MNVGEGDSARLRSIMFVTGVPPSLPPSLVHSLAHSVREDLIDLS